ARYTFRDGVLNAPFTATPVPGYWAFGNNRNHFLTIQETRVFSPTVINTFRAGLARLAPVSEVSTIAEELSISTIPGRATQKGLGQLTVGGMDQLGQRSSRPTQAHNTTFQVSDAVDFILGGHSVKVGTEIVRYRVNFLYEQNFSGVYAFSNLRAFLQGTPNSFTGVVPGSDGYRGWRWGTYGFYAQDEWRMFPNFTLNLGLRYEPYSNVTEANDKIATLLDPLKDTKVTVIPELYGTNPGTKIYQPRFGLAWDPFSNGKTAIRGGFGMFYDRIHSNSYNNQNTGVPFATTFRLNNPSFPQALKPGQTVNVTSVTVGTIMSYHDFKYPYTMQWNLTVQQEIVPSTVVSATYAASRGVHVLMQGQMDLNKSEIRDGKKFFPRLGDRINPAFSGIGGKLPQGNSHFHSLQLNLRRRMTAGLQLQAGYTWSKSIDDGTTFGAAPVGNSSADVPDVYDTRLSRGLADLDMRHNFVVNSTYQLPFAKGNRWLGGWQLSGIMKLSSGIPFGQYVGFERARSQDRGGGASAPDRVGTVAIDSRNVDRYFDLNAFALQPAGFFGNAGRNSVVGPGFAGVDFSVMKNFPITERVSIRWNADIFNLFNRASFASPGDAAAGSSAGLSLFSDATSGVVPTAGKIQRTTSSGRQIQMGLKINF
ncbi:MAG: TonB-dependent receptor, partial [Acidobacteria bacterium]|nr:TonB-dependent receptor [Acidobacteriota bacterium]